MSALLVFVTILVYVLAVALWIRQGSLRYLLMLFAGHLTMLLTPLWEFLYRIEPLQGEGLALLGRFEVPWSVLICGGPLIALPALVFYYGLRHHWWPRHYATVWSGFLIVIVYFLVIETLLQRSGTLVFADTLVVANTQIPTSIVQAVLLSSVSLGMLYAMVSTRHYALEVAIIPLLLSGIVSSVLFLGIFASPLWVLSLLNQSGLILTGAAIVSLLLVLWGVHLLPSGLHAGRRQQFVWR